MNRRVFLKDCVICFENLCQPSDYATSAVDPEALAVVSLKKCGHMFHKLCLKALCSSGTEARQSCLEFLILCLIVWLN